MRGRWNHNVSEHFIGFKNVFSLLIGFGNDGKFGSADFALAFGAGQLKLCAERYERRRET